MENTGNATSTWTSTTIAEAVVNEKLIGDRYGVFLQETKPNRSSLYP
jgi:hypothetical protein